VFLHVLLPFFVGVQNSPLASARACAPGIVKAVRKLNASTGCNAILVLEIVVGRHHLDGLVLSIE
jgi:hypothetical protein